jgi:hypothetical protein
MATIKHYPEPTDWLIKRDRKGDDHITANGSKGYAVKGYSQIHHIVPVTCLKDGTINQTVTKANEFQFIRCCLAETDWDINAKPNTVGLPLKNAFYEKKRLPQRKAWNGWPCHMVDHDLYYKDVSGYLQENVWEPLLEERKKCVFDPKSVLSELNGASDHFYAFLKDRGSNACGGTMVCWDNRLNPNLAGTWFIPFSMGVNSIRPRKPPSSLSDPVSKLFEALVK